MVDNYSHAAAIARYGVLVTRLRNLSFGFDSTGARVDVWNQIEALHNQMMRSGSCYSQPYKHHKRAFIEYRFSPSLMPWQCSTPPEVCYWASSFHFREEHEDLACAVSYGKYNDNAPLRLAIINVAYKQGYYAVARYGYFNYPPGATGKKQLQPKLPPGCKGLKRNWDQGIPEDDDVYVPNGISRKIEHRPSNGRWFFPRPSKLRNEYVPE